MEDFISNINTMWGVVALAIFSAYKVIDYLIKNSDKKKSDYALSSNFKELKDSLEDHVEIYNRFTTDIHKQIKRLEILQMIHQNPHRKIRIKSLYEEYKSLGGNSYIDDVVEEWSSAQKPLKSSKSKKVLNHE